MSALREMADRQIACSDPHLGRVETALKRLAARPRWVVSWSGGKDSAVCLDLALRACGEVIALMGDDGADPIARRALAGQWAERDGLTILIRPDRSSDAANRRATGALLHRLGAPGVILGLRAAESGYRRRIMRALAPDGTYTTSAQWGGLPALCPLVRWSDDDVYAYIAAHGLAHWSGERGKRSPHARSWL